MLTIMLNAYFNEFSLEKQRNNNDLLHTWLVQTKFNMGTLDCDNDHQSFWQLGRTTFAEVLFLFFLAHCVV